MITPISSNTPANVRVRICRSSQQFERGFVLTCLGQLDDAIAAHSSSFGLLSVRMSRKAFFSSSFLGPCSPAAYSESE